VPAGLGHGDSRGHDRSEVFNLRRPFGTALPKTAFGEAATARVAATGRPVVTPLLAGRVSGIYTTNIGVAVKRRRIVTHVLIVAIDPLTWLVFLRS
jgi:hypothetical protein